ncbi:DUF2911 domain-containing protein [Polaribacter sp.]|uniref:DUF2911 domain-containing protein n=1 Tax=Polaribacter sp. TaxID=1920175 RepID=UPI003F699B08
MKKYLVKILSILSILTFVVMISCQNKDTKEIVVQEVKKSLPTKIAAPAPSPSATLKQKVGLTDVSITYSRPGMKGRAIFGNLVPFDKIWRTGANKNTEVTFSTEVMVGDKNVAAGTYALYTKPGKNKWDVILYSASDNWGNPKEWDDAKVVASATVDVIKMAMDVETFTITIDDITNNSALLGLLWENVYVGMPFTVPTDKAVMASIDEVLSGKPNARAYYDAAVYYNSENKDIKKTVTMIDKAIEMSKENPQFWILRQQSLIHAKAGKTATAIAAAKLSLALANKAGNADYVKMNEDSLKEWGAK